MNATRTNLLRAMERHGDIQRVGRGLYTYVPDPVEMWIAQDAAAG